jgi:hypothetical protein
MAIRWYQHSVHGVNVAISEKKRLPMVASVATNHAAMTPRAWIARAIVAYASRAGSR